MLFLFGKGTCQRSEYVDQMTYDSLKTEIPFDKTQRALVPRKKPKIKAKEIKTRDKRSPLSMPGFGGAFQLLMYVLLIGIILGLLYIIFSNIKIESKSEIGEFNIDEIERIEDIDTDLLYKQSIERGDYRTAIRMRYIRLLQILQEREQINWTKDKTNRDYLNELRASTFYNDFKSLSTIFDYTWYGHKEISINQFEYFDKTFHEFNRTYEA